MLNQFNNFLINNLISWLSGKIAAGYRYRFYSDDSENILSLVEALNEIHTSTVTYEGIELPYIQIDAFKLVYVNDVTGSMNENFISNLRDAISTPEDVFQGCALLVLHKSRLDTVLNSATDLSSLSAPFNAEYVETDLDTLLLKTSNAIIFKALMKMQTKIIKEEQQSAFGYKSLFHSISSDSVNFKELGLLNDPDLSKEIDPIKIQKRLEKNQVLHDEIETTIINFPAELEDRLTKYSDDFIRKNITVDDWEDVPYNKLIQEIDKNKGSSISFDSLDIADGTFQIRDESTSAAGKRTKNIILFTNKNLVSLFFKFKGDGLKTEQFKVLDNNDLVNSVTLNYMGISRTLEVNVPYNLEPLYFTVKLQGDKASETFTFKILVLQENSFYLENIYNHFIVKPKDKSLLLQISDFNINFSDKVHSEYVLKDDETVNINVNPNINVSDLYNTQDEVLFSITNGTDNLKFSIEGKKVEQVISIPLLYNRDRLDKLFHNGANQNAEINHSNQKAVLEHREFPLVAKRFTYIDLEHSFIHEELFYKKNQPCLVKDLENIDSKIYETYENLLVYFRDHKTTPSLCAWDNKVCDLASKFVDSFQNYMMKIKTNTSLSSKQKLVFDIGKANIDGKEYLSPFSPLILAYILYLRDMSADDSFKDISKVTLDRLNPKGLFPYLYNGNDQYAYTRVVSHDSLWLEFVPNEDNQFSYVSKLTTEKIIEFTKAFGKLFEFRHDAPLIINSINNGTNKEVFRGIVDYYKKTYGSNPKRIIVNLYDQDFHETDFDIFADTDPYEEIKNVYKLDKNAETIIDVMRTHITYSKHLLSENQNYAHLSFFKNNEKVQIRPNKVHLRKSGLVCSGLISGESSEEENGYYYSGFGLRDIDIADKRHLQIAKLYNSMQRSAFEPGVLYDDEEVISLMISDNFRQLLEQSYRNSLWTVIIDPKVTLDFFDNEKDLILIHYSDQYSSSANYDAITITAQKELYANVVGNESIIREFNAFNGEWLIKMIAEKDERNKREKKGIIAAYKYITAIVDVPEVTWVPLSVAEMLRVAGNVGLSMSKGDFSRYNEMSSNQELLGGAISDDILLVGFCKEGVVLYPVEVKSGSADMNKAIKQAKSLKSFFYDFLFKGDLFKANLLKGLFIRQVFMQVDKYELYDVFDEEYFKPLHSKREELLKGSYPLVELEKYSEGAVVAFLDTQFDSSFAIKEGILECRLPSSYQNHMLEESYSDLKTKVKKGDFSTNTSYILQNANCAKVDTKENPIIEEVRAEVTPPEPVEIIEPVVEDIIVEPQDSKEPMKIKFGTNVQREEEILWYPTDTTKTLNTNTGIIGTMGTGKTQFTKSLIAQMMYNIDKNVNQTPIGILIFDYKGDYIKPDFTEPTGAKVLEPYHLPYNPLALFGDRPLLPVHTTNLFKTTLAKAFGLGTVQQSNLNRIILEAYERRGISRSDRSTWSKEAPTIQDIWDVYSNEEKVSYDSLYAALEKLISFEIFEPKPESTTSLYDLLDGITVINLSGYDPDIQNLIVAITLDIFYTQMHIQGSSRLNGDFREIRKMILVDEADNFMSQDFESLKKILKEGREFGVGTILSTQQLTHFKTSEDNYANYLQTWIIHQVSNIKSQDITSIFNISNKYEAEGLMEQIRRLEKHFSIYVDGNKNMTKMRDLAFFELKKD